MGDMGRGVYDDLYYDTHKDIYMMHIICIQIIHRIMIHTKIYI